MYGRRRRVRRQRRPMVVMPRVRDEMKTNDAAITITPSTDGTKAATMQVLNIVPRGTTATERVGKKIVMKALQIRGNLLAGASTAAAKVSILLIYVRSQNNMTDLPAWDTILKSQSPNALTERDNASQFKILRRWDYQLVGNLGTAGQGQSNSAFVFEEYITFKKPLVTQWSAANSDGIFTAMEKGGLILAGVSNLTAADGGVPSFTGNSRIYFHETDGYAY